MTIAAQDHQQIRNHRGSAVVVELNNLVSTQVIERLLDHTDGPLDNLRSSRHDRAGLLTLKHRCCDFGSISQMANPGFDHLHTRLPQPILNVLL